MNPNNRMRSWLRRQPQPAKVMLDGSPKRVLDVPQGRDRWRDLLKTLAVEDPETITLLDAEGRTLRAGPWEPEEDEDEKGDELVLKEKEFPIAALGSVFRQLVADLVGPYHKCMEQMVASMQASDARAQQLAEAQADAIREQAKAEAQAIVAQAKADADDGGIVGAFAKGMGFAGQPPKPPTNGDPNAA